MPADATIANQTRIDPKGIQENALQNFQVDWTLRRKPEYFVHIYYLSRMPQTIENGFIKNLKVAGCPIDKPYVKLFSLPDVVTQAWQDPDSAQVRTFSEDGRRVAMDIINPANMGLDQEKEFAPNEIVSQGGNLGAWGMFWSLNDPPEPMELEKARKRMEKFYRQLTTEADTFARNNRPELIIEKHHIAADYFHYAGHGNWHTAMEAPETCPNCGELVKAGVAFHKISDDTICVINWDRASAAGVKKPEDRPGYQATQQVNKPEKPVRTI